MAEIHFSDDEQGLQKGPFLLGQAGAPSAAPSPTSSAPYQQPSPTPTTAPWMVNHQIQIDVVPPPQGSGLPGDPDTMAAAQEMRKQFEKTNGGPALLKEIAAFPDRVVDPPKGHGLDPLSPEQRRQLPKVKYIKLTLLTENPKTDYVGDFGPPWYSATYEVKVTLVRDAPKNPSDRFTFFPPVVGLKKEDYILFGHLKSASRMATSLFHELLHVWFAYKYCFYFLQTYHNTGHGAYEIPSPPATSFYDVVQDGGRDTFPFRERLSAFYKEIDDLEGAHPPAQPTPLVPWK